VDLATEMNPTSKGDDGSATYSAFVISSRTALLRALVAHHGPEVAVEALSDAYVYAWQHWARISIMDNPTGYVFRVADRMGIRANQRLRSTPTETRDFDGTLADSHWLDSDNPLDQALVVATLRTLPTRQRAAVLLVHGYGWSYKETANTLDVPVTTITNDVNRALLKLRQQPPAGYLED
jgi:DNA-directed RNA polymerase specialized sigma24 family protein